MSWIWQKQKGKLNNKIKRNTGWKSPNIVSQCVPTNINVVISEKTDPIDPAELQILINSGITTANERKQPFYIEDDAFNNNKIYKSLWKDLSNIKTISNNRFDYATLLSINTFDENITNMSPLISCRDFNFNIPNSATITGIEIKITKSDYSEPSAQNSPSTCNDSNLYVENLYNNYTYDDVVTISLNNECNQDFYNDTLFINARNNFNINDMVPQYTFISNFKNYSNPWIPANWDSSISYNIYNILGYDESPIINYDDGVTNHQIIQPKGIWSENKETQLYGGENDMWGSNSMILTPTAINNSDFGMYFKANQYISRSYSGFYYNKMSFNNNGEKQLYFDNILNETPYNSCVGYEVSKLHDIQIRVHYELDSSVKTLDARENIFLSGTTLLTDDIYFKYQKCFDGICYQYINDIKNIYDKSLKTGDGISINNMYNEYNIIDKYCSNIYKVDIATKEQINLNNNYFEIDNINLKPGHKVLLLDQQDQKNNDIYIVNENYFLENSNILSTNDKSYRAKVYVKMGTYSQEQYSLNDFGNKFPIIGESKTFTTGHSYIIKNYIDYNIKNTKTGYTYDLSGNTISNPNKIIFTNYKIARTLSEEKTWNDIEFIPTSALTINYLNDSYTLTSKYGEIYYDMTGSTSSQTYYTWSGLSFFSIDSNFYNHSSIGDHSLLSFKKGIGIFDNEMIPTTSEFNYLSKIRYIDSNYVAYDEIPTYIINDILTGNTAYTFRVRNLHYCSDTIESYENHLRYSPYSDILNFKKIVGLNIKPYDNQYKNMSDYYKWFDFNLITINNSGDSNTYKFTTNKQYQNYKLKPFLDMLGVTPELIYNSAYYLSDEYYIEEIWENTEYDKDGSFHSSGGTNSTYYSRQSSRWKIIPYNTNKLKKFRKNTYIDYGILTTGNTGVVIPYSFINNDTGRTLITEVTDKYMIVEKPRLEHDPSSSYYNPTINKLNGLTYDIINVSKTKDISDILYELYLSYEHSYYYYYSDSFYNRICSAYAEIIKENELIRNMTTGIIYLKNDIFNFDIFDININDNFKHLNDTNLTYKPIELIDIGIDNKTKLPIPLIIDNIDIKNSSFLYFTGKTEFNYGGIDNKSFMKDSVIIDNKLYFLIQYQGKLYFNNEETSGGTYLQKYYTQNNATLIFDKNLSETGLSYYYYIDIRGNNSTNIGFFNSRIKSDISGKTYQFGVSSHDTTDITWNNTDTYFDIKNSINTLNDSIKRKGAASNFDIGYLIVYENNGNINTAITYSGEVNRLTYTNDVEIIDNYNYVYNSNNGDYYQSKNNAGRNLLYDGPGGKKSSILLRYSNNFNVIDWKILYYSLDNNGNIYQLLSTDKSLKLIKDSNEKYLYQTLTTKKLTNKLKIERINSAYTYFYQYDNNLYSDNNTFSIIKLTKDGDFIWLKPIYFPDSTKSPELIDIIYEKKYLYISINTNTKLIIDGVTYGENTIEIKHYVIKLNDSGEIIWVNILGELNDTIGTDMKIYNNKYLFVSGNFINTTKISNYNLSSNGEISSYVCKIDIKTGDILSVFDKHSTKIIKIKTLDIIDDNIYIGGDFIGGTFLGGIKQINYIETTNSRVFVEQIKINSI